MSHLHCNANSTVWVPSFIQLLFAQVCCVFIPVNPSMLGLASLSIQSIQEAYFLLHLKNVWHVKTMISNLLGNHSEQLVNNCSFSWHIFSVDCIERERTASPVCFPLRPFTTSCFSFSSSSSSAHLVFHVSVGHVWARAGVLLSSGLGRERDERMKEGGKEETLGR